MLGTLLTLISGVCRKSASVNESLQVFQFLLIYVDGFGIGLLFNYGCSSITGIETSDRLSALSAHSTPTTLIRVGLLTVNGLCKLT
jgi:hypothetical protein